MLSSIIRFLGSSISALLLVAASAQAQKVGEFWSDLTSDFAERICVTYGAGVFVAGSTAAAGRIDFSADGGKTWTTTSSGLTENIASIARVGSTFYAVGGNGLATSSDGHTWVASTPFGTATMYGITGSGTTLVAVGSNAGVGVIYLSTNSGTTWTKRALAKGTQPLAYVIRAATLYMAVGAGNTVLTSPTGAVWTAHPTPSKVHNSSLLSVAASPSTFVVVGGDINGGGVVFTSPNGITWTEQTTSNQPFPPTFFTDVKWTGANFVAVGEDSPAYTSPDGVAWRVHPMIATDPYATVTLWALGWSGTELLGVGVSGAVLSTDNLPIANFTTALAEVSEGAGTATVSVLLTCPAPASIALPITVSGTAVSGTDFSGVPASVNFATGEYFKTFNVTLIDTAVLDDTKSLVLTLGAAAGVHLGQIPAEEVSIVDNDSAPEVTFYDSYRKVRESVGTVSVEAHLSHAAAATVTVPLTVLTGAGKASSGDYSGVPASLTFTPGQVSTTFSVTIVDDNMAENDEELHLRFGPGITGATSSGSDSTIIIEDNDPETEQGKLWRLRNPQPEDKGLDAVAYLGSKLVVVGGRGLAMTSTDNGLHWQTHSIGGTDNSFHIVVSGGGKLVAAGSDGAIATSLDGESWTTQSLAINGSYFYFNDLVWTGSLYVAVGSGSAISGNDSAPWLFTSPDGVSWTRRYVTVNSGAIFGIAWNGAKLVAVGADYGAPSSQSVILTSTDGITWEDHTSAMPTVEFSSVMWAGTVGTPLATDRFIAFDGTTSCYTSTDGNTWTKQTGKLGKGTARWGVWNSTTKKVTAVGGAVSTSKDGTGTVWTQTALTTSEDLWHVAFSPTGGTFAVGRHHSLFSLTTSPPKKLNTGVTTSNGSDLRGVAWSGDDFVAVGGHRYFKGAPAVIVKSQDGINWTNVPNSLKGQLRSIAWSGTTYVAVGTEGLIASSANGTTWVKRGNPAPTTILNCVIWAGNQFVAVGGADGYDNPFGLGSIPATVVVLTSPDGQTWTQQQTYGDQPLESIAWNGATFVAVGRESFNSQNGPIIMTTNDVTNWGPHQTSAITFLPLISVVWNGSKFIAINLAHEMQESTDGITWTDSRFAFLSDASPITSACWTGSKLISTTSSGNTIVSTDGLSGLAHLTDTHNALYGITSNGAMTVAVGEDLTIVTSGTGLPATHEVKFAAGNSSVNEAAGTATILVTMSPPPVNFITVPYTLTQGTGLNLTGVEADVTLPAVKTLVFTPGETAKFISVKIINDHKAEANETLKFTLQPVNPANAATIVGSPDHTLTIMDDDTAPVVTIIGGADKIITTTKPSFSAFFPNTNFIHLEASATGSEPLTYQWTRNGTPIAGATSSVFFKENVTIADGGVYACTASNSVAKSVPSLTSVNIGVVEALNRGINLKDGAKDVIMTETGSTNLDYQWFKDGSATEFPAIVGESVYSTTKDKLTLLKKTPFTASGVYLCKATLKTNPGVSIDANRYGVSITTEPDLGTITFDLGTVGKEYIFGLSSLGGPVDTWGVKGLPSGLSLLPTTNLIYGFPKVAGTFSITVTATNGAGSDTRTVQLKIDPLPTPFVGSLIGLVPQDDWNKQLGGLMTLTLASNGTFTGSLVSGNLKQAFSGQGNATDSTTGIVADFVLNDSRAHLLLTYDETSTTPSVGVLKLTNAAGVDTTNTLNFYRAKKGASLTTMAGRYNFSFDYTTKPGSGDNMPLGVGFGSADTTTGGVINWTVRMGDGSVASASSFVNMDDSATLYAPLHNGLEACGANPSLSGGSINSTTAYWIKQPDVATAASRRDYPMGWASTPMTISGNRWITPGATVNPLGTTPTPGPSNTNATLAFKDGGVEFTKPAPDVDVNLKTTGAIETIFSSFNPRGTTLAVTKTNGTFTGTFTMLDTMPNGKPLTRKVTYFGQLIPDGPSKIGVGVFQLPQMPEGTLFPMPAPDTTPILAGSVSLMSTF